jgi:hypothetical protein
VSPWDAGDGGRTDIDAIREPEHISDAGAITLGKSVAIALSFRYDTGGERLAGSGNPEPDPRPGDGASRSRSGPRP